MRITAWFLIAFFLFALVPAHARTAYVSDYSKINVRSGRGTDYRIIAILNTGESVQMLEDDGDWARIQMADGQEGWMLSRLLTTEEPCRRILSRKESELAQAVEKARVLAEENSRLLERNSVLEQETALSKEKWASLQERYEQLSGESSDLFAMKQAVEDATQEAARYRQTAMEAEQNLARLKRDVSWRWFLIGAGVLFFGFLIGNIGKRKRASSLLR